MNMSHKTGSRMKGKTVTAAGIIHVEDMDCPEGGKHDLINNSKAETFCSKCKVSWGDLDKVNR